MSLSCALLSPGVSTQNFARVVPHDPATKLPCVQNTIQIEIALSLAFYVHDITRRQTQTRDFGISACTVEFSWLLERGVVTEGRLAPLP